MVKPFFCFIIVGQTEGKLERQWIFSSLGPGPGRGPANVLIVKFSVWSEEWGVSQPRWASHHYAPVSFPPSSVQQAGTVREQRIMLILMSPHRELLSGYSDTLWWHWQQCWVLSLSYQVRSEEQWGVTPAHHLVMECRVEVTTYNCPASTSFCQFLSTIRRLIQVAGFYFNHSFSLTWYWNNKQSPPTCVDSLVLIVCSAKCCQRGGILETYQQSAFFC